MADKVHPNYSKLDAPPAPPGTYVIQIPKDQIYKYPSPENARKYQSLSKQKIRRSFCSSCCCFILCFLLLFIISAAITSAVLYLVFRPESPDYTISQVVIKGLNLSSSRPISPEFDVSVRANNPNNKIGIYYEDDSKVEMYYGDTELASGVLPVFYQGSNNLTVLHVALKDTNLLLGNALKSRMRTEESKGKVPFLLKLRVPVKIKIGSIKTWNMTVKVNCDITVDALIQNSKIVFKDCNYHVRLW